MQRIRSDVGSLGAVWFGAAVGAGIVAVVFAAMPVLMIAYAFWDKLLRAVGVL